MSQVDARMYIIAPMKRIFARPKQIEASDEGEALKEYQEALASFTEAECKRAWEIIRDTHNNAWWPPIAKIKAELVKVRKHRGNTAEQVAPGALEDHNWGGGCTCEWCRGDAVARGKRRKGFFQAPKDQQRQYNEEGRKLNAWIRAEAAKKPTRPRRSTEEILAGTFSMPRKKLSETKREIDSGQLWDSTETRTPYQASPPDLVSKAKALVDRVKAEQAEKDARE